MDCSNSWQVQQFACIFNLKIINAMCYTEQFYFWGREALWVYLYQLLAYQFS